MIIIIIKKIINGCEKLAQKDYKRQQDNVAKKVRWDLCKKNRLEHTKNGMKTSQKEQQKTKK